MINKKEVINIIGTETSRGFMDKCKILGLSKEKQIEILNKKYKNQLLFKEIRGYVTLINILTPVSILELPVVEDLKIRLNNMNDDKTFRSMYESTNRTKEILKHLRVVKLPPTITDLRELCFNKAFNIEALWVWDTSNIMDIYKSNDNSFGRNGRALVENNASLNRVIVQHVDGSRPTLIKIK